MSLIPLERAPDTSQDRDFDREPSRVKLEIAQPGSALWDKGVELEAAVFMRRGFVSSAEELAEEYAPYLSKSAMLVATRRDGEKLAGVSRVVEYDPTIGFKTIDDALDEAKPLIITDEGWQIVNDIERNNIYEVGTISAYQDAGAELYGAIIGYGIDMKPPRRYVIASLDEQVLEKRIIPLFTDAVQRLGPPADYMGSLTVPILYDCQKAWDNCRDNTEFSATVERIARGREMISDGH